jgi:hypothetical protein
MAKRRNGNRRAEIKDNLSAGRKKHRQGGGGQGGGGGGGYDYLTNPLTAGDARRQAGADARAEYGPAIRGKKGEIGGSLHREKQIGEWFGGLEERIGQTAQATDASYAQANNALLAHAKAAADAAQASQGQIAQNNLDLTKLTGADPSLTTPALAEGAAAAGQRAITNQALAAPIAQAGASQASYLRNTGLNARREGIEQRGLQGSRRQKLKEDLTALRNERAQKAVGNFREIKGEERKYDVEKKAFGLEGKEAQADAAEAAADQRLEEEKLQETQRHNRATEANDEGDGGGGGGEKKQEWNNAKSATRTLYESKEWKSWGALIRAVQKEPEVNPAMARRAVERLRKHVEAEENKQSVENLQKNYPHR